MKIMSLSRRDDWSSRRHPERISRSSLALPVCRLEARFPATNRVHWECASPLVRMLRPSDVKGFLYQLALGVKAMRRGSCLSLLMFLCLSAPAWATHRSGGDRPTVDRSWAKPEGWGGRPSPFFALGHPVKFDAGKPILQRNAVLLKEGLELVDEWSGDVAANRDKIMTTFGCFMLLQAKRDLSWLDRELEAIKKEAKGPEKTERIERLGRILKRDLVGALYRYYQDQYQRVVEAGKIEDASTQKLVELLSEGVVAAAKEAEEYFERRAREDSVDTIAVRYQMNTLEKPTDDFKLGKKLAADKRRALLGLDRPTLFRLESLARELWRDPEKKRFNALIDLVTDPKAFEKQLLIEELALPSRTGFEIPYNETAERPETKALTAHLSTLGVDDLKNLKHVTTDFLTYRDLVRKPAELTSAVIAAHKEKVPEKRETTWRGRLPSPLWAYNKDEPNGWGVGLRAFPTDQPHVIQEQLERLRDSVKYFFGGRHLFGDRTTKGLIDNLANGAFTRQDLIDAFGEVAKTWNEPLDLVERYKGKSLDELATFAEKWEIVMAMRAQLQLQVAAVDKIAEKAARAAHGDDVIARYDDMIKFEESLLSKKGKMGEWERRTKVRDYLLEKLKVKDWERWKREWEGRSAKRWPEKDGIIQKLDQDIVTTTRYIDKILTHYELYRDSKNALYDLKVGFQDFTNPDTWRGRDVKLDTMKLPFFAPDPLEGKGAQRDSYHSANAYNDYHRSLNARVYDWAFAAVHDPQITRGELIRAIDPLHKAVKGTSLSAEWDDSPAYLGGQPNHEERALLDELVRSLYNTANDAFTESGTEYFRLRSERKDY